MSFDLFESVSSIRARDLRHDETSFASTMMDCGASPKGLSPVRRALMFCTKACGDSPRLAMTSFVRTPTSARRKRKASGTDAV